MRRDSCQLELAGGISLAWSCAGPVQPFRKAVPAACSVPPALSVLPAVGS